MSLLKLPLRVLRPCRHPSLHPPYTAEHLLCTLPHAGTKRTGLEAHSLSSKRPQRVAFPLRILFLNKVQIKNPQNISSDFRCHPF